MKKKAQNILNGKQFVLNLALITSLIFLMETMHATVVSPAAETTCDFDAFANEQDSVGLNVRAEPHVKSKILGKIPPAIFERPGNGSQYLIKPELKVIGSKNGWFKITNAKDNETLMETLAELKPRPMFSGTGWVTGNKLTVKSQSDAAYSKPSKVSKVVHKKTNELSFDTMDSYRLKDCLGKWVYVEDVRLKKNKLYWINSICGIQETSCSGMNH